MSTSSTPLSSSPAPGATALLTDEQKLTLKTMVNAASAINSGKKVLEVAESLYGKRAVEEADRDRRAAESQIGVGEWHGESDSFKALARVYVALNEQGQDEAAGKLDAIALGRLVRADWERNVQNAHREAGGGW